MSLDKSKPHDKFSKGVLHLKNIVKYLLINLFGEDLLEIIDFETIEYPKESFIDEKDKEQFTDVLVKIKFKPRFRTHFFKNCIFFLLCGKRSHLSVILVLYELKGIKQGCHDLIII